MYQPGGSFGKFAVNIDRKSVVEGKRVDLGGWRIIKKKKRAREQVGGRNAGIVLVLQPAARYNFRQQHLVQIRSNLVRLELQLWCQLQRSQTYNGKVCV